MLVVSPSLMALLAEVSMAQAPHTLVQVYKCCLYEGCCGRNATDWIYLMVYPLFTVIMLALGSCHPACKREAMYLRSLEGFVAAAGQVVLSLVVLSRGVLIHSLAQTIHYLTTDDPQQRETFLQAERPIRWYWGLIQAASLVLSLVSLLQTVVYFNECEKRRLSAWRLMVSVPFYAVTIWYVTTNHTYLSFSAPNFPY